MGTYGKSQNQTATSVSKRIAGVVHIVNEKTHLVLSSWFRPFFYFLFLQLFTSPPLKW
jgi:hypothetical protein